MKFLLRKRRAKFRHLGYRKQVIPIVEKAMANFLLRISVNSSYVVLGIYDIASEGLPSLQSTSPSFKSILEHNARINFALSTERSENTGILRMNDKIFACLNAFVLSFSSMISPKIAVIKTANSCQLKKS